jgi:hypothetical protein
MANYGISLYDVNSNKVIFEERENERFHLASVVKMIILIEVLKLVEDNKISLNEQIESSKLGFFKGTIFDYFDNRKDFSIKELLYLMITFSNSIIADYFINLLGKDYLNKRFHKLELYDTKVNLTILELNILSYGLDETYCEKLNTWRKFYDFFIENKDSFNRKECFQRNKEFDYCRYNYSTPLEIRKYINDFLSSKIINQELTNIAKGILKQQSARFRMRFMVPPNIEWNIGNQIGTIAEDNKFIVINDCGFIDVNGKQIILVFFTNNIRTDFYKINLSIAEITKLVYEKYV